MPTFRPTASLEAALSNVPVPPYAKLGFGGLGLTALLLTNHPSPSPDGDNDNDRVPEAVDPDDDNDLIPDVIDPNPLISCELAGGVCETPAQDSCEEGDVP